MCDIGKLRTFASLLPTSVSHVSGIPLSVITFDNEKQ